MLARHGLIALLISFGLSIAFWQFWGVFVMPGFVLMSLAAAAGGAAIGWLTGKRLWVTGIATTVLRLAIYFIATAG